MNSEKQMGRDGEGSGPDLASGTTPVYTWSEENY
jgi:hypothetical protein